LTLGFEKNILRLTAGVVFLSLAARGGTVASSDKKISVNIASGALKGDTYFKIVAKDSLTGLPSAYVLVAGTAFEIDWSGARIKIRENVFNALSLG
jgi:hypothetical protein